MGHGLKMEREDVREQLVINWMDGQLIPIAILDFCHVIIQNMYTTKILMHG